MNKAQTLPFLLLLVVTLLLIYLCLYCPWLGDDIRYMFNFATGDHIKEFKDIIISQNEHYYSVNGRYVAHVLVQTFCGLSNHIVFAICNGLVFMAFVLMTLRLTGVKFSNIALSIVCVSLCFLGFQTRMVPSCQIGYMWMFTLTMVVLWLYLHKLDVKKRWWWILLPFSIIAGWGQEALNLGVCGAMIIYAWQHKKSMTLTQWAILFAYGFGALLLVVSPGSLHRVSDVHGREHSFQLMHNITLFLIYVCVIYVLMIVLAIGTVSKRLNLWQCYKDNAFYWHIFIICLAMNIYISVFCNRQFFGMEFAALILTLKVLRSMEFKKLNASLVAFVMVWLVWVSYHDIKTVNAFSKDYAEMIAAYRSSKDGIVYMDSRKLSQPFPCKNVCEEFLSEWGLSNINFLLKSDPNNDDKTFVLLPTALNPLPASNAYVGDCNNNLYVVCNAENTSGFSVIRHKEFLGHRFPRQEYMVNVNDKKPLYHIQDKIVYIMAHASWYETDSVTFQTIQ